MPWAVPGWFQAAERWLALAEPLSALDQAIGYRSIVSDLQPVERHTARSPPTGSARCSPGSAKVGRVHG